MTRFPSPVVTHADVRGRLGGQKGKAVFIEYDVIDRSEKAGGRSKQRPYGGHMSVYGRSKQRPYGGHMSVYGRSKQRPGGLMQPK